MAANGKCLMPTLSIATYNIEMGGIGREDNLLAVLKQLNADVVGLTEADDEKVVATLAHQLDMDYQWARGSGDRHVATLSRYPIRRWAIYNRHPLTQAALSTTLELPFRGLPELTLYNTHFRPDPFWHFEIFRFLAAWKLRRVIKQEGHSPTIIFGDFNTYARGDSVDLATLLRYTSDLDKRRHARQRYKFLRLSHAHLLRAGYTDCYRAVNPTENGWTFTRHKTPISRMDFVLADAEMKTRLCAAMVVTDPLTVDASDHFPVLTQFSVCA